MSGSDLFVEDNILVDQDERGQVRAGSSGGSSQVAPKWWLELVFWEFGDLVLVEGKWEPPAL